MVDDELSRDEKQKRSAGVDSLERNGLATITENYKPPRHHFFQIEIAPWSPALQKSFYLTSPIFWYLQARPGRA